MAKPDPLSERRTLRTVVLIALGVSVLSTLLVGYTVWFTWRKWVFLTYGTHVQGRVTAVEQTASDDGGTLYKPTFAFVDAAGRSWNVLPPRWAHYHEYHVGDSVPVSYDPSDPGGAMVNTFESLFSWEAIVGLCVLLFVLSPSLAATYYCGKELRQLNLSTSLLLG